MWMDRKVAGGDWTAVIVFSSPLCPFPINRSLRRLAVLSDANASAPPTFQTTQRRAMCDLKWWTADLSQWSEVPAGWQTQCWAAVLTVSRSSRVFHVLPHSFFTFSSVVSEIPKFSPSSSLPVRNLGVLSLLCPSPGRRLAWQQVNELYCILPLKALCELSESP